MCGLVQQPMKKWLPAITGAIALLLSSAVDARSGWTDYAQVVELVPTSRHYYKFRLSLKSIPGSCRDKSWFYQNYGTLGSDKMYDTLMESIKSGLRVRVYLTGICNVHGHSEISSVSLVR